MIDYKLKPETMYELMCLEEQDLLFYRASALLLDSSMEPVETVEHEIYDFVSKLKAYKLLSVEDKEYITSFTLVEDVHGRHFIDDIRRPDISIEHLRLSDVAKQFKILSTRNLFHSLDRFYYGFLIPWIVNDDIEDEYEEFKAKLDDYLVDVHQLG